MNKRNIILLAAALLIAAVTATALRSRMQPDEDGTQAPKASAMQRILVAKSNIPAGSFVKSGDLDWVSWPADTIQSFYIREGQGEDMSSYQGAVSRRAIKQGEPITSSIMVKPGAGGFLSAVLEPGKRAVSIAVTATSGNAGFIFPGDRVDLIVTHRMKVKETQSEAEQDTVISETFVENVRVVAVDQMLDNPENKAILAKTVTVEVSPQQAQQIAVAEDLGKISLTLRSIASDSEAHSAQGGFSHSTNESEDPYIAALEESSMQGKGHISRDTDVSRALNRTGMVSPRVLVIRGDQSERREFYQDGR